MTYDIYVHAYMYVGVNIYLYIYTYIHIYTAAVFAQVFAFAWLNGAASRRHR